MLPKLVLEKKHENEDRVVSYMFYAQLYSLSSYKKERNPAGERHGKFLPKTAMGKAEIPRKHHLGWMAMPG